MHSVVLIRNNTRQDECYCRHVYIFLMSHLSWQRTFTKFLEPVIALLGLEAYFDVCITIFPLSLQVRAVELSQQVRAVEFGVQIRLCTQCPMYIPDG